MNCAGGWLSYKDRERERVKFQYEQDMWEHSPYILDLVDELCRWMVVLQRQRESVEFQYEQYMWAYKTRETM